MRAIAATFFLLSTLSAFAGKKPEIVIPFDSTDNKYGYTEVIDAAGLTPEALYKNSKAWILAKYMSQETKVDMTNEKIIADGSFSITSTMKSGMIKMPIPYTVNFDIVLDFKDGKYRYRLTNIKMSQNSEGTTAEQSLKTFIEQQESMGMGKKIMLRFIESTCHIMHEEFTKVIEELKLGMAGKTAGPDNDW